MGGRKFRLSTHRKNEERKRRREEEEQLVTPLTVSLPIEFYFGGLSAYKALMSSGCLRLPSQRTLRDYAHYVDKMLMDTAKVGSCPEREKCTLLLTG